jgi:ATP-dependent protease ClpP protease subunit
MGGLIFMNSMKGRSPITMKSPQKTPRYSLSISAEDGDDMKPQRESGNMSNQTNQLFFYSDVTRDSIYVLNRQLVEAEKQLRLVQIQYNLSVLPPLELYISSEGGEVYSAFTAVDRIMASKIPVDTYVEGIAASAATLLSVVGRKRYIRKNANMLIHQVSSAMWGNYAQFQDEMKNLDLVTSMIKKIYLKHTKFKEKDLNEMLKHDICLSPEECVKYGLCDEII